MNVVFLNFTDNYGVYLSILNTKGICFKLSSKLEYHLKQLPIMSSNPDTPCVGTTAR